MISTIEKAKAKGIKTWCSFEPLVDMKNALNCIHAFAKKFDKVKIGKLNYHKSDIDWEILGKQAEELCKYAKVGYYIKDSLRKEMDRENRL